MDLERIMQLALGVPDVVSNTGRQRCMAEAGRRLCEDESVRKFDTFDTAVTELIRCLGIAHERGDLDRYLCGFNDDVNSVLRPILHDDFDTSSGISVTDDQLKLGRPILAALRSWVTANPRFADDARAVG